jgi:hypothetical protein
MKVFTLILSAVMFLAALVGITGSPLGGSDRTPPRNNATVFFQNAWLTLKFGTINMARDLGSIAAQAFENTWAGLARIGLVAPMRLCVTTVERSTEVRDAVIENHPMAATTKILLGVLVALDSSGNAVNAADTAGLHVIGRAEQTVDNTSGSAGDLTINVRRGCFKYDNSGTQAVTAAYKDKVVYVEDHQTVAISTTNFIVAGRVVEVATDGVWVDTTKRGPINAKSAQTIGSALVAITGGESPTEAEHNSMLALVNQLRVAVLAIETKINGG